ncbi:hypothetical protein [Emticicia agri]|uniref:Uncharacterized protein n=1 Tax=Emticicia agri TaxID=2492393 RepID=A0A4Q5LZU0_9BACT|nr:hypothetical protein [Emticicia agri]RYU95235.1 hypothetical protein EWM59_13380 [Emticicia agri]
MKNFCSQIVIAIAVFAVICLGCQEKKQDIAVVKADSTCARMLGVDEMIYKHEPIDKTLSWIKDRFRLDTVTKEKDFEIRIFLEQNFGGILYINYSLVNNQWKGFHVRNQNKINTLIPPKGWENFTERLRDYNVFNLLTHKEIEDGKYGKYDIGLAYKSTDGTHYYVEIIAGKQYEFRYYDNVDIDIVNYPHFVELQQLSEFLKLVIPHYADFLKNQNADWEKVRRRNKLMDTDSNSFISR